MKKISKILLFTSLISSLGCATGVSKLFGNISKEIKADTIVVHIGDKVKVPTHVFTYGGLTKEVKGTILFPDGSTYEGDYFNPTICGRYKIVYKAYFNTYIEKKFEQEYICERRVIDTFDVDENTSVSYGDYRYNTETTKHTGVILDMKNGASPTFNLPINVSKLTKDTPFIDLIIDPSKQDEADFSKLTIRVSDVTNENNYVDVVLDDGGLNFVFGLGLNAKAGANGQLIAGYHSYGGAESANYQTSTFDGAPMFSSFRARPANNPTRDLKLYFDYADKSLYGTPSAIGSIASLNFINKLDNDVFYATNPWFGFDSDTVKISIIPSNFESTSCRVVVKSICGYDFSKYVMEDNEKPRISINYKNQNPQELPLAKKGDFYTIFDSKVTDNFDYYLNADVNVKHIDSATGKATDVTLKDNKFYVGKDGVYYIYYNAKDLFGNKADEVKLRIKTSNELSDIDISLPISEVSGFLYDEILIPTIDDLFVSGGSGILELSRVVKDVKGNKISINENKLKLEQIGDYIVTYTAMDYLGHTKDFNYKVKSLAPDNPIFIGVPNLPPVLVKGFTYNIPSFNAIEGVDGEVKEVKAICNINGEVKEDTFIAEGSSLNVKYVATGVSGVTTYSIDIPVIDGNETINRAAYFFGNMNVTENEENITLTSDSSDKSVTFANKLNGFDFILDFEKENVSTNYSNFIIKLTDATDSSISLTFKVNFEAKKLYMPYYGIAEFKESTFNDYRFEYINETKQIIGAESVKVGSVLYDDAGNAFNGFKDGVYLTMSFEGLESTSSIKLTKLNSHVLGYRSYLNQPSWVKPELYASESVITRQYIGDEFIYPEVKAYDVFGEIDETSLRIRDPENKNKITGDLSTKDTFILDKYGSYRIEYSATNKNGRKNTLTLTSFVFDDINPTLNVGDMKNEYSLNSAIELPSYSTSDNSGSVSVDMYLISPLGEVSILLHDEDANDESEPTYFLLDENLYPSIFRVSKTEFKVTQKGNYTLRVVAYDKQFNKVTVEKSFIVK